MKKMFGRRNVIFGGIDEAVDDQPMFWNNDDGWGSLPTATLFTDEEKAAFQALPRYNDRSTSVWVKLPDPSKTATIKVLE